MRTNVRAFVEIAAEAFCLEGPVYEFGSYLVEGQAGRGDLRKLFPGRKFVGCDMREGPGVDRVCDLACLDLPDECARTVLCLDTLEHVFEARRAVEEMIRILAPGGMLLVSVPMDFRIHDYPSDYWRITPACLARLLAPLGRHAHRLAGRGELSAHRAGHRLQDARHEPFCSRGESLSGQLPVVAGRSGRASSLAVSG